MKSFSDLARLKAQMAEHARQEREQAAQRARAIRAQEGEARVFREAIGDTVPLRDRGRVAHTRPLPSVQPLQRQADEREALQASLSDEIDIEQLLETDETLSFHRRGIGADIPRRLRRGEWVVQAQLDLHGLRSEEAREALVEFLAAARKRSIRCVRIIHGKGLGSINKEPVLKNKTLKWLVQREDVLAFCQARPNDGGGGALLVLLRGGAVERRRAMATAAATPHQPQADSTTSRSRATFL